MRIVSGQAGGIRLQAPRGNAVRPTSDRVKESLFGSLGDLTGITLVDLFAGSGALGLEAMSRGAERLAFVERSPRHITCIRQNLERVRKAMHTPPDDIRILRTDAQRAPAALADWTGNIDFILADPPYHPGPGDFGAAALLNDRSIAAWADGAHLVLEHETGTDLPWHPHSPWHLIRLRRYGTQSIAIAECTNTP